MRGGLTALAGALALGLIGCTALAPGARTASQATPPAAEARPPTGPAEPAPGRAAIAPSQPGSAPGVVPPAEAARAVAAPAQIAPSAPSLPPAPSAAGLTVVGVSRGGAPALATAGTGDVLSGVLAAMLAKRLEPFTAACAGVLLHVRAGRRAAERLGGPGGVIATDVIAALPASLHGP
jgi:hypothetical protein